MCDDVGDGLLLLFCYGNGLLYIGMMDGFVVLRMCDM